MTHSTLIPVDPAFAGASRVNADQLAAMREAALADPEAFWLAQGDRLTWIKKPTRAKNTDFTGDVEIKWYEDGVLNVSVNCLDRHLATHGNQAAIIWEGDDPEQHQIITYRDLYARVCKCGNALRKLGVKKGDTVTLYLPMIPETAVAMLACARIGAIHSVVFGGFAPESLASRINDCASRVVITADEGRRGGKHVKLKYNLDEALYHCPTVEHVMVVQVTGNHCPMHSGRDQDFHYLCDQLPATCVPEPMGAEDPLFILYTSGSTGKPKGVIHTSAGYLLWASYTYELIFDYRPGEVYWCTADVGWVTGHTYILYGPLTNGATTLMFEGVPTYPDAGRFWQVIDKHAVNIFYTAPTALRSLMREGDALVQQSSRASLRVLGSVGEPINPEVWQWYWRVVGDGRCPIVDTWWQTETGGALISPLPGAVALKPGSATLPLPGVYPVLVDAEGKILEGAAEGNLCIADSWPGQARTLFGDHVRFAQTYFSTYHGLYFTGDGARRDEDGYWWITGRVDDVLNVSGHRLGTAELESALVAHPAVAEAAVVGFPHDIKGQGIYAYVTLKHDISPTDHLRDLLVKFVRHEIGPIATPDVIQWAPGLPKTRSGKIMRRILRKIAADEIDGLGDLSTLADPSVVGELVENRTRQPD